MRIGIIQFPGSNCERETELAVKRAGMQPVPFLWNQDKKELAAMEGYILVGGFSYEDRVRSGIIAALDPVLNTLRQESEKGKPVLGICNGAQILVESGMVPGLKGYQVGAALTDNKRILNGVIQGTGFYNTWVHMRSTQNTTQSAFTRQINTSTIFKLPIAHAEGRFIIPAQLLNEMRSKGLIAFQYCNAEGQIYTEFPVNPNGSVDNIAAITNAAGNVMAMMPHPERVTECDSIFHSMRDYIVDGCKQRDIALDYAPIPEPSQRFVRKTDSIEIQVKLNITDNHEMSANQAISRLNLPFQLKRSIHWEIQCKSTEVFEKILESGVLFNSRKESYCIVKPEPFQGRKRFLVRAKEDMLGMQKKQILENHFGIEGIQAISHGIFWEIAANHDSAEMSQKLNQSHLLYNPYTHEYYTYE